MNMKDTNPCPATLSQGVAVMAPFARVARITGFYHGDFSYCDIFTLATLHMLLGQPLVV